MTASSFDMKGNLYFLIYQVHVDISIRFYQPASNYEKYPYSIETSIGFKVLVHVGKVAVVELL